MSGEPPREWARRKGDRTHRRVLKWGAVAPLAAFGGWNLVYALYSALDPLWGALGRFLERMAGG